MQGMRREPNGEKAGFESVAYDAEVFFYFGLTEREGK